jgi:hypothetical protein
MQKDRCFVRLPIVARPATCSGKSAFPIEGDGRNVGFAHFQENASYAVLLYQTQKFFEQKSSVALAAVFRGYRDVQDFDFLAKVPPLQQRDHFTGPFTYVDEG